MLSEMFGPKRPKQGPHANFVTTGGMLHFTVTYMTLGYERGRHVGQPKWQCDGLAPRHACTTYLTQVTSAHNGVLWASLKSAAAILSRPMLYPPPCLRHEKRVRGTPLVSQLFSDLELSVLLF